MAPEQDADQPEHVNAQPLSPTRPDTAAQVVQDIQAVNQQLLLASLREQTLAEELRHQLAFITAITTSLGEGVYVLDITARCTFVNPAAEQMLGWAEGDLLGTHVQAAIPMQPTLGVSIGWEDSILADVIRSGTRAQNVEVVITRRDGTSFPGTYSAAPMIIETQVVGVAVNLRDITELHRLHQI